MSKNFKKKVILLYSDEKIFYFILFIFSLGISCSFISIFGLVLTLLQIPFTIIISLIEESEISKNDENYFDYKNETPMLIPEIRTLLKKVK